MNERIRELLLEARDQTKEGKWNAPSAVWAEKFAELIVRECADLIDNKKMITAPETYDEVFWTRYDTKEQCAKEIRKHFGVQE